MWLKKGFIRINRIKEELIENQWGVKIEKGSYTLLGIEQQSQ